MDKVLETEPFGSCGWESQEQACADELAFSLLLLHGAGACTEATAWLVSDC